LNLEHYVKRVQEEILAVGNRADDSDNSPRYRAVPRPVPTFRD
jgi:hypothetical protein